MSLEDPTTQEEWLAEFSEGGAGETGENFEGGDEDSSGGKEGKAQNEAVIESMLLWCMSQCY